MLDRLLHHDSEGAALALPGFIALWPEWLIYSCVPEITAVFSIASRNWAGGK